MMIRYLILITCLTCVTGAEPDAASASQLIKSKAALISEHCWGGLPIADASDVYARNAYIIDYDDERRVPRWVAYHATPSYVDMKPNRKGDWKKFKVDPDIDGEMKDSDYNGVHTKQGYARGHLVPYFVCGGDRDGDQTYASQGFGDNNEDREVDDTDDEQTVLQINYMSNIAPQIHPAFNGTSGIWYAVETLNRDTLIRGLQLETWVYAGCIYAETLNERDTVASKDGERIAQVPEAFWKIIIFKYDHKWESLAFLFPHKERGPESVQDLLVSIDTIEILTGLDFFKGQAWAEGIEAQSSYATYERLKDVLEAD